MSKHNRATTLPTDPKERKKYPIATGVLDYFPDAIVAVARVSYEGNKQHNPGEPLHWAREKSMDQDDTEMRHFLERGKFDTDGQRHSAKKAWRALAALQLEIEADQAEKEERHPLSELCLVWSPKLGAKYACCSLLKGHSGEHRAHDSHDISREYEAWI